MGDADNLSAGEVRRRLERYRQKERQEAQRRALSKMTDKEKQVGGREAWSLLRDACGFVGR